MISEDNVYEFVYNLDNKFVTKKYLDKLLLDYGIKYKIKNLKLFQLALTHKSYTDNIEEQLKTFETHQDIEYLPIKYDKCIVPLQKKSYERLEFTGDSVLHLVIASYLFKRYPNQDEGFMTKLRIKMEDKKRFAELSVKLGLNNYVLISKFLESKGARFNNVDIQEDIFEAFIFALFEDSCENYKLCRNFIINVIERHLNIAKLINKVENYKEYMVKLYNKKHWTQPTYHIMMEVKSGKDREFIVCTKDTKGKLLGVGKGSTKKKAEQVAAYASLDKLGISFTKEPDLDLSIIDLEF